MKAVGAIATTQAAQTIVITPAMVWGASLATGIVWLLLGLTGTARYVTSLINRPVRRRSPPIGIRCGCCDLRSSRVPDAACVVASFIRRSIKALEEWPHSGRATEKEQVRRLVISNYPYLIYYRCRATS